MLASQTWFVLDLGMFASLHMFVCASEACLGAGSWMMQLHTGSSTSKQTGQCPYTRRMQNCNKRFASVLMYVTTKGHAEMLSYSIQNNVEPMHQMLLVV